MQQEQKIGRISLMRIGIFDPYLDDLGGGEKYMATIAQCLSQKNEVDIFWDNKKDVEKIIERFSLDLSKVNLKDNIFSSKTPFLKKLKQTLGYDAIIFLSNGSIPLVFSKKLFIHFQQPLPIANKNFKTRIKIARVNSFFCNSEFTKAFIDKNLGVNSRVLYPPVDIKPKKVKKENIILHVGRFRLNNEKTGDYKKQDVMVNSFKEMFDSGLRNWKFVLAVSVRGKDLGEFEKLIQSAKGFPVEFLINKNNNDLWELYSKAKIYWHASGFGENLVKHPEFAEHFGISTVEAMGAGAVPVVINAGGQKEIVENAQNGYLWDTLDELKAKTKSLIENEKMWQKLSKEALKTAEKFNAEKFCDGINDLILR